MNRGKKGKQGKAAVMAVLLTASLTMNSVVIGADVGVEGVMFVVEAGVEVPEIVYAGSDYDPVTWLTLPEGYDGTPVVTYYSSRGEELEEKPVYIGNYSFSVSADATDSFGPVEINKTSYTLSWYPLPEISYTLSELEGVSNECFVRSGIVVPAPDGFQFRLEAGDEVFGDTMVLTEQNIGIEIEDEGNTWYALNMDLFVSVRKTPDGTQEGGALCDSITLSNLLPDLETVVFDPEPPALFGLPLIDGVETEITEGARIVAEQVELTVADLYLDKAIDQDENELSLAETEGDERAAKGVFTAISGTTQEITVSATDMAGNEFSLSFTLVHPDDKVEYLDVPEGGFSIGGIENESYAKEEVLVIPPAGYLIKKSESEAAAPYLAFTSDMAERLRTLSEPALSVVLVEEESEKQTREFNLLERLPLLLDLTFDNTVPVVGTPLVDGETLVIKDGDTVSAKQVEIIVSDKNLKEVTFGDGTTISGDALYEDDNGELCAKLSFIFISEEGATPLSISFTARDMAGNESDTLSFTLTYPENEETTEEETTEEETTEEETTEEETTEEETTEEETTEEETTEEETTEEETTEEETTEEETTEEETTEEETTEEETTEEETTEEGTTEEQTTEEETTEEETSEEESSTEETETEPETETGEGENSGKIDPILAVSVKESYIGQQLKPQVHTESDGTVTFYYKKKGSADSTYTTVAPTQMGTYVVKAETNATAKYYAATATAEFILLFLPAPAKAYTIEGKKGEAGYYTSAVTLTAPDGYLISKTENGSFEKSVLYTDRMTYIYLMRQEDGARTAAVVISDEIKIDSEAPELVGSCIDENGRSVDITKTIFADELTVTIYDENLSSVSVNGKEAEVKDGRARLTLAPETEEEAFEVKAVDKAGNTFTQTFVIAPQKKQEELTVTSAGKKTLKKNVCYTLGEGRWMIEGDNTVYAGGMNFFVREEGEYTFILVSE